MIVTCPGCTAKYRVRDEAVPPEGAELQCASCAALFVAHPPRHSDSEIGAALERITQAKDAAEQKLAELEGQRRNIETRALDAEGQVKNLEAQVLGLKGEVMSAQADARNMRLPLEIELSELRQDHAKLLERANLSAAAETRVLKLDTELARAKAAEANHAPQIERLTQELQSVRTTSGRLSTDLESEQQSVQRLLAELKELRHSDGEVTAEVKRLKDDLSRNAQLMPATATSASVSGLVSAVGPMLWGLEQAIGYLQPFSANEAALAAHVRQLQLLQSVLQRLQKEAAG